MKEKLTISLPQRTNPFEKVVIADGGHGTMLTSEPLYASLLASWARDDSQRKRLLGMAAEAEVA